MLETREGFIREGNGYDAAMASLDLALLYLKDGRTADVRRLAEEMATLFEAQDVHREALAAVVLFREAARREEVTAALVGEVRRVLALDGAGARQKLLTGGGRISWRTDNS